MVPVAATAADWLVNRQAPDLIGEIVGEERLEHARQFRALAECFSACACLPIASGTSAGAAPSAVLMPTSSAGCLSTGKPAFDGIDLDPVKRDFDVGGNLAKRR